MTRTIKRDLLGFTLIELLVVVMVIALLIAILLPVLGRARNSAQATVCSSNIAQLALANQAYATDNDGHFVLAARDMWSSNHERWHGKRDTTGEPFDPAEGDLSPYFGESGAVKQCPVFVRGQHYRDGFEDGSGGYGYNGSYIGGRSDLYGSSPEAAKHSARVHQVREPTRTVMFTDSAYIIDADYNKAAYSFCEPPFWQLSAGSPSSMRPDPTIDFRHLGQTSVAWADGHVDRRDLTFSVSYQTHSHIEGAAAAEMGVGWFGPEDNSRFDLR